MVTVSSAVTLILKRFSPTSMFGMMYEMFGATVLSIGMITSFLSRNWTVALWSLTNASNSMLVCSLATTAVYSVMAGSNAGVRDARVGSLSNTSRLLRVASSDPVSSVPFTAISKEWLSEVQVLPELCENTDPLAMFQSLALPGSTLSEPVL